MPLVIPSPAGHVSIAFEPGANPAGEDPHETIEAFEKAHQDTITELRARIAQNMPFIGRLQFTVPSQDGKHPVITMPIGPPDRTAIGRHLTPVMARLDP